MNSRSDNRRGANGAEENTANGVAMVWQLCLLFSVLFLCSGKLVAAEMEIDLGLTDLRLTAFNYWERTEEFKKYAIQSNGIERTYFAYSPRPEGTQLPVLVALHGANRSGASMIDVWKPLADKYGFMIIAPNGTGGGWALQDTELLHIRRVIQHELNSRKNQTADIFLFGHSAGAVEALALTAASPNYFRRIAVHAGALALAPVPTKPAVTYESPVAIYLGDSDKLFSLEAARKTGRWLESLGMDSTLFILKRHGHWYYADAEKINESIWTWLNRK